VTRGRLIALCAGLGVVALLLAGRLLGGNPSGAPASSYGTTLGGVAAYAELLARANVRVEQLRDPLGSATLDPKSTVFLLSSPPLGKAATRRLRDFVEAGGVLVVSPSALDGGAVADLLGTDAPAWEARVLPDATGRSGPFAGLRVHSVAPGAWRPSPGTTALVASPDGAHVLLAERRLGRGRIELLSSTSPLTNGRLADADDAAFGVRLAAGRTRAVFAEAVHGYLPANGWDALPTSFDVAFALLGLAVVVLILARFRRLGPPERTTRDLPPPRSEYAESLGRSLALTRDRGKALEPLRLDARRRLATLGGTPDEDAALARTARELGFEREVEALRVPAVDDASAVALARVAAKIARHGTRRERG
jgi:hypothetical protein